MNRPARLALPPWLLPALAALLSGCPLPQALPTYPSTGNIAPPRIQSDGASPGLTVILVAPDCLVSAGQQPVFTLAASLVDENTLETDEARWFVDYQPDVQSAALPRRPIEIIPGPEDGVTTVRVVSPWGFQPYGFDSLGSVDSPASQAFRDGGGLHVVELVVSNGFAPEPASGAPPLPLPWRTPLPQFETQVYRWVFHYVPASAGGACAFPPP